MIKKLKDMTNDDLISWKKLNCDKLLCKNCPFYYINCSNQYFDGIFSQGKNKNPKSPLNNLDKLSEKILNQTFDIPNQVFDEEEIKYLTRYIKKYLKNTYDIKIQKHSMGAFEWIGIIYTMYGLVYGVEFKPFFKGEMYKGMETNVTYTIADLGVTEDDLY